MVASRSQHQNAWGVTRLANACILLEIGTAKILSDPWFQQNRAFTEHSPILPSELPVLDAIVGGHWVKDHWEIDAFKNYTYKDRTKVYVADRSMEQSARSVGFTQVEHLPWGETRQVTDDVLIEAIQEHQFWGRQTSNYAIYSNDIRIFLGTECLNIEAIRHYAQRREPFDVVLGPVNGVHVMGQKLVLTAIELLEVAQLLGASTLVPIHDAHRALLKMVTVTSSVRDLDRVDLQGIAVVELDPGERFAPHD